MSSELSSCLNALRAAFADSKDKYIAHERARPVLLDMAASPAVFTAILNRHLAGADALTMKHYPVVSLDIETNAYSGLVANCWIPLPDRDTNMSTKAIHHHGQMLLTTVTAFGPGYEHWTFTTPEPIDRAGEVYRMRLLERAPHPRGHAAFVDANIGHLPFYPPSLTITLALWSSRQPTTWKDVVKRVPTLHKHSMALRGIADSLGLRRMLDLKVAEYFDFFPSTEGFRGMKDRLEFGRGPNEDYLYSLFHIIQETHNEALAPVVRQRLVPSGDPERRARGVPSRRSPAWATNRRPALARALRRPIRELPFRRNRARADGVRGAHRIHARIVQGIMAANSLLRRAVKATLHPVMNETTYSYLQGVAKALDIRRGKWYEPELDLISVAVRPGDEVLDIGANYGFYTYHLSRAVGPTGRVYAFEPVPFTNRTLVLVARLLGLRNVTLVPKGCSDVAGTVAFTLPIQRSGAPSSGQAHIGTRNDNRAGSETQVRWDRTAQIQCEVVALDDYLPRLNSLSLIKCDIEGAELLAFRGAARIIETHRPCVICEINPWFLDGFGLRLEDLIAFFTSRGYGLYRYTSEKLLAPITSAGEIAEDNYVFVHRDRLPSFAALLKSR